MAVIDMSEVRLGMGATVSIGSDSYAATVVAIHGRVIEVAYDRETGLEGIVLAGEGHGRHFFRVRADGSHYSVRRTERGTFKATDRSRRGGFRLRLGVRTTYRDPSF